MDVQVAADVRTQQVGEWVCGAALPHSMWLSCLAESRMPLIPACTPKLTIKTPLLCKWTVPGAALLI